MRADADPCGAHDAALPEYVDACLRGADARVLFPAVYRHLRRCDSCAFLIAEAVSVIRWREAAAPFNAPALPDAIPAAPPGFTGDCPCVH